MIKSTDAETLVVLATRVYWAKEQPKAEYAVGLVVLDVEMYSVSFRC